MSRALLPPRWRGARGELYRAHGRHLKRFFAVFAGIDEVICRAKFAQVLRIKRVLSSRRISVRPSSGPTVGATAFPVQTCNPRSKIRCKSNWVCSLLSLSLSSPRCLRLRRRLPDRRAGPPRKQILKAVASGIWVSWRANNSRPSFCWRSSRRRQRRTWPGNRCPASSSATPSSICHGRAESRARWPRAEYCRRR